MPDRQRIVAVCSLCGHEYTKLSDVAELDAHMAEAHGMYFDPRPFGTYGRVSDD